MYVYKCIIESKYSKQGWVSKNISGLKQGCHRQENIFSGKSFSKIFFDKSIYFPKLHQISIFMLFAGI